MNQWIVTFIIISIDPQSFLQGSEEKIDYPICVKDPYGFKALTVDGTRSNITVLYNNSATLCTSLCKASQYIFSGTKNRLCICGNKIQDDIEESSTCESKCPGNREETCGGKDSVSLSRTGYVTKTPRPIDPETPSNIDYSSSSQPTEASSDIDLILPSQPSEDDFTDEATENPLSVFPPTDATNTLSSKIDVNSTIEVIKLPRPLSEINGAHIMEANVTSESTENTSLVVLSTQADTKASVAKWFQMTAVYVWLPVGIMFAGFVVLIGFLLLRYKRRKSVVSVKRREVSSEDDHYQTLDPEFSQYVERSTQTITTAGDNCDAGYLTPMNFTGTARCVKPIDSNAFAGYITPIHSNAFAGYITPMDSNVTAGYITPNDSNAVAGYITPMDSNDTKENYNYYVEIDA